MVEACGGGGRRDDSIGPSPRNRFGLDLPLGRGSGFYPDIFMGYPEPLRQLRKLGVVEQQARFFSKNRGVALLIRSGNPLGIKGLSDVLKAGTRIAPGVGPPLLIRRPRAAPNRVRC